MQAERIPKINTVLQQFFVQFPRGFGCCDDDLFDLGKLMDAPNTTIGLTMGTNLSAEARGNANNLQWKKFLRNGFLHVHRSQRMLRCSNHVVTIWVDNIHHRLKVRQIRDAFVGSTVHHDRWLHEGEATLLNEINCIGLQGHFQSC